MPARPAAAIGDGLVALRSPASARGRPMARCADPALAQPASAAAGAGGRRSASASRRSVWAASWFWPAPASSRRLQLIGQSRPVRHQLWPYRAAQDRAVPGRLDAGGSQPAVAHRPADVGRSRGARRDLWCRSAIETCLVSRSSRPRHFLHPRCPAVHDDAGLAVLLAVQPGHVNEDADLRRRGGDQRAADRRCGPAAGGGDAAGAASGCRPLPYLSAIIAAAGAGRSRC